MKKGLLILGLQGGYIGSSQGGPYGELSSFLTTTEDGQQYKVRYGIKKSQFDSPDPAGYPTTLSPYGPQPLTSLQPVTFPSGKPTFDQLSSEQGSSFELHLHSYVLNNLNQCMDFSVFETEEGTTIIAGEKTADIVIAPEEVSFTLNYPIHATNKRTDEDITLRAFKATVPLRLGAMHEIMKTMLDNDVKDITFPFPEGGLAPGLTMNVDRTTNNPNDMITLTDTTVHLNGKPYMLKFARKNRAPALRYFHDFSYTLPTNPPAPFTITPDMLEYDGKTEGKPPVDDPDEDAANIVYQTINNDGDPVLLPIGGIQLNGETKQLIITATDNYLTDSQTITISPAS